MASDYRSKEYQKNQELNTPQEYFSNPQHNHHRNRDAELLGNSNSETKLQVNKRKNLRVDGECPEFLINPDTVGDL
jgi:hypothetical protein